MKFGVFERTIPKQKIFLFSRLFAGKLLFVTNMHRHGHGHRHGHSHSHGHPGAPTGEGEEEVHIKSVASIRKLMKLAVPEIWFIIFGFLALLVSSLVNLALPYAMGRIFDSATQVSSIKQLIKL